MIVKGPHIWAVVCLGVDGVHKTLRVLRDIEASFFKHVTFVKVVQLMHAASASNALATGQVTDDLRSASPSRQSTSFNMLRAL